MRRVHQRLRLHAPALLYFDEVRRSRSIRGAASRLNVAASAVNRQILNLEAELGSKLFDRAPAGLKLTTAGEVLARHVSTVLADADRAKSELDALQGLRSGHVEIATIEGICHDLLPAALGTLRARHPRVTVGVQILSTQDIPEAIVSGDAHLGLAFQVERRPELRQIAVGRFRLGAVMRPDLALAEAHSINLRDCNDYPLILPRANFANHAQLRPLLARAKRIGRPQIEAASIELMKQLVLRGVGIAFMTRVGLTAEIAEGRLVHIPLQEAGKPIFSELGLYARDDVALPVAAAAFSQYVADIIVDRARS